MPSNSGAWLTGSKVRPLVVKSAPYTSPSAHQIVVKAGAVAINPVDYFKQDMGEFLFSWIKYPTILGEDVAGEVVEVGAGVTRFKVGDRVVGHALGMEKERNRAAECAFQNYVVLLDHMVSPLPNTMSYENACVIPLGISTASSGLFQEDQLHLQSPSEPRRQPTNKTLLIWGGSSSIGCNAIQLAVAAGYEVIATASPKNFEVVKKLGASQVFDYKSKTVVQDLTKAFKGKKTAGAMTIGPGGAEAAMDVLRHCKGNKFIAMVSYPTLQPVPTSFVVPRMAFYYVSWNISHMIKGFTRGIRSKFVWGSTLAFNGVGKVVYEDYLPKALAAGSFVPSPEPEVVGTGLENIQVAWDAHKKGVSAKKLVVALE